jgi:hypothetical protein
MLSSFMKKQGVELPDHYCASDNDSSANTAGSSSTITLDQVEPTAHCSRFEIACPMTATRSSSQKPLKKMPLTLMHKLLGHRQPRALIAASAAGVCWADYSVDLSNDDMCISCEVGAIRASNKGHKQVSTSQQPGQVWFSDLQTNPSSAVSHIHDLLIIRERTKDDDE